MVEIFGLSLETSDVDVVEDSDSLISAGTGLEVDSLEVDDGFTEEVELLEVLDGAGAVDDVGSSPVVKVWESSSASS